MIALYPNLSWSPLLLGKVLANSHYEEPHGLGQASTITVTTFLSRHVNRRRKDSFVITPIPSGRRSKKVGVYVAGCGLFHPGPLDVSPVELRRRYKGEGSGRFSSSSGTLRLCLAAARSIRSTHCNASTIQPYSVDSFPWTRAGRQHSLAQPPPWTSAIGVLSIR